MSYLVCNLLTTAAAALLGATVAAAKAAVRIAEAFTTAASAAEAAGSFASAMVDKGTAVDIDGALDKETTSYDDIFDAFRLALKFYHFE
ncbi:MAG: hypothetical protein ACJ71K_22470 [Nitrososphaeraceae archaeon]